MDSITEAVQRAVTNGTVDMKIREQMNDMGRVSNSASLADMVVYVATLWPHAGEVREGAPSAFEAFMEDALEETRISALKRIAEAAYELWTTA